MVPYMTIIHDLVDSLPSVKQRWKEQRQLLFQLTQAAKRLSLKHQQCLAELLEHDPGSNHSVASSTALEIATQEIREELTAMEDGPASIESTEFFLDPPQLRPLKTSPTE
jgi:hypothetical protein